MTKDYELSMFAHQKLLHFDKTHEMAEHRICL